MFNTDHVLAAGYKRHKDSMEGSLGLFQRKVLGPNGETLYFINFHLWRHPKTEGDSWSVEVRLYHSERDSFDLNFMIHDHSIAEVESFYESAFKMLWCVPDVHN